MTGYWLVPTNPDNKDFMGADRYLVPTEGRLRWVERLDAHGEPERVLQRFEWSHSLKDRDWFDVELYDDKLNKVDS